MMYTNSDITLYSYKDGVYIRRYIKEVFWKETIQKNLSKEGTRGADAVFISIPAADLTDLTFTPKKDIIVKGFCKLEFDNSSDKGISDSLKELKRISKIYELSDASDKLYGSVNVQHYELNCR